MSVFDIPYGPFVAGIIGFIAVLIWRLRETQRPVTTRGIVIPPLGMSTGLSMFALPAFRVPWLWGIAAFALGALVFARPLVRSTKLQRRGDSVMMRRSRAFLAILLGLAAVRLALRQYVGQFMSAPQTAALFFTLAFGMIVRWRVEMLLAYRKLQPQNCSTRR
jgi:membrane protein CcdC involved in cytochrome C biogenesis